jgi:hypothetical protein
MLRSGFTGASEIRPYTEGHSFVSESYKASSGKALERTNTSSPSQSDLGTEEAITAENKDKPLVFPLLG